MLRSSACAGPGIVSHEQIAAIFNEAGYKWAIIPCSIRSKKCPPDVPGKTRIEDGGPGSYPRDNVRAAKGGDGAM